MPKATRLKISVTQRIALILVVVFLIPVLFFTVYELAALNRNESMIQEIYQKQLEAILFSVNQYSDDAVNSWMTKAEAAFARSEDLQQNPAITQLLSLNPAIRILYRVDTMPGINRISLAALDTIQPDTMTAELEAVLNENRNNIQQLVKYFNSGFQKTFVLSDSTHRLGDYTSLIFISESTNTRVSGFLIDTEIFIEDFVGPRLQSIAQDQFILSVFDKQSEAAVYSTRTYDSTSLSSVVLTKDLWVFPDYALGIRLEGASLQQLIRERTFTNLYLLIGLSLILVVALIFTFRSIKKEVQLAQNKADFVSNVSHEIRTPLALISMFAETLELDRVKSEEKKREYYSIISQEAHRLTGIVNKILNFSQAEAGKKTLNPVPVELTREIKAVLRTYDYHLHNKGFEYAFSDQEPVHVLADPQALTEIIINLIDNAIKYSQEKKRIEIYTGAGNGRGWISIRDYGIGISKTDLKHIFDKFYRVSSGNLAKSPGTGIGLSLVKQLVEQQNGAISVTSELGVGSTFTVYFPLTA